MGLSTTVLAESPVGGEFASGRTSATVGSSTSGAALGARRGELRECGKTKDTRPLGEVLRGNLNGSSVDIVERDGTEDELPDGVEEVPVDIGCGEGRCESIGQLQDNVNDVKLIDLTGFHTTHGINTVPEATGI